MSFRPIPGRFGGPPVIGCRLQGWLGLGVAWVLSLMVLAPVQPAQAQEAPRKYALLIGINEYTAEMENVPRLRFARNDAEQLCEELEQRGWDARKVVDEDASRRRIIQELMRIAAVAKPQDTVLVYFAGHGLRDKVGREHTYWLTYPSTLSSLAVDALRLTHLMEYVGDIPAGRKVVILDHCHSGDVDRVALDGGPARGVGEPAAGGAGESLSRDAAGRPQVTRNLFPKEGFVQTVEDAGISGLVVLGAARDDAYEFDDLGHGMFTYGLLKALRDPETDVDEDKMLSFQELWVSARDEMMRQAQLKGVVQEPIEVTQGKNLSLWNDLFEAALGSDDDLAAERDALQQFLTQLDSDVSDLPLDLAEEQRWNRVLVACVASLMGWHMALASDPPQEPNELDLEIVNELKAVQHLSGQSTMTMKVMLEIKVEGLIGRGGETP
ncbi:MAG: caspase family protein [Acidobacteriota bacterium]|nr:caspase family protein [Acidobacteriota bacterium]